MSAPMAEHMISDIRDRLKQECSHHHSTWMLECQTGLL